jgi:hypothetical protein
MRLAQVVMGKVLATLFYNFDVKALNKLGGPAGPGGERWIEEGSKHAVSGRATRIHLCVYADIVSPAFPHKWIGWETEITPR